MKFLQKQLKNLKDKLKKCLDKQARMTRSGAAAASLPRCKYFEETAFAQEKGANKPTESNIQIALQPETPKNLSPCLSTAKESSKNDNHSPAIYRKKQHFTPKRPRCKVSTNASKALLFRYL